MCLGIPGKVVKWIDRDPLFAQAQVEFAAIRRVCHMACVPDAEEGEYVVVHAGIAISKVNAMQAAKLLAEIEQLGDDDGWSHEVVT